MVNKLYKTECLGNFTITKSKDIHFEGEISFICDKCMGKLILIWLRELNKKSKPSKNLKKMVGRKIKK